MDWGQFLLFIVVGFAAQMVDGAIGMAYGISATTVLMSLGASPATASACVHAAEVFTTAASGISHWRLGNVDFALLRRLALPGMLGGALGAYALANIDGNQIRPFISAYLLLMGGYILWKALSENSAEREPPRHISLLGFAGGFLDAIGGGGWGPLVASSLIGAGTKPRYAIGTVNLTEFLVTATTTATFVFTIGLELWPIILGLIVGGVLAAPFAAMATKKIPDKPMMFLVAAVVILLSLRNLVLTLT
ncbi:MAG: sulfite exporter TauE/SafE family protein [Alphaproteobacteria bacterium]|nr:sulfite exporter TauE/SafE family protein [Alphaproteobacteria bacterium]